MVSVNNLMTILLSTLVIAYKRQKLNQNARYIKETETCYFFSNNSIFSNIFPACPYAPLLPYTTKMINGQSQLLTF